MALPNFTTQTLWRLSLTLGVGLLAACNSENATDNKTTLVPDVQSCSRGATALFAACDDQSITTNEILVNNDTVIAGDTVVTTAGSGVDDKSQNTVVILDNLIANPTAETDLTTQPILVAENHNEELPNNVVTDPNIEAIPDALPTPAAIPSYDDEIAQINKLWTDYSATVIATHKDNHIESIYQYGHTFAMLAAGAGTGPTTDAPYLIVKEDGTVIDPNTLQAIIGSTYATPDGMEHLHKLLDSWDQKLLQQNVAVDWQRSNALWVQAEYPVLNSFLDTQIRYYAPEIVGLDFRNDMYGSGQFIATWLNAVSQDRLTPLLSFSGNQINEQTGLVTLNSEAVSAPWPELFDATQTTDERFKMLDGTMKLVPTMHSTGTFDIAASDQYMAFQLPIQNSTLAMLVIMPKVGQFAAIQTQLDTSPLLEQIIAELRPTSTTLHLPRFAIATIQEVNIPSASDKAFADFSAVNGQGHLYLKQMAQMATVEVMESGMISRAGGVNILNTTDTPLINAPNAPSDISAIWVGQDLNSTVGQTFGFNSYNNLTSTPCYYPALLHPFMFVIRDTTTSTPLYAGVWTTPGGAQMAPDWTVSLGQSCEEASNPGTGTPNPFANYP